MFVNDYLIPGIQLVKSNQRIVLHHILLIILGIILYTLGTVIVIIPVVAGFTYAKIPVPTTMPSFEELNTIVTGQMPVLAGAAITVLLFLLNYLVWSTFYLSGLITDIADPKDSISELVRSSFGAVGKSFGTLVLLLVAVVLIAGVFGGGGWFASDSMKNQQIMIAGAIIGGVLLTIFSFFSSLALFAANLDAVGVLESISLSARAVTADLLNYIALLITLGVIQILMYGIPLAVGLYAGVVAMPITASSLAFPTFCYVLASLLVTPITFSALTGYYYVNKGSKQKSEPPQKTEAPKQPPTQPPKAVQTEQQAPVQKEDAKKADTTGEETRKALDRILSEI